MCSWMTRNIVACTLNRESRMSVIRTIFSNTKAVLVRNPPVRVYLHQGNGDVMISVWPFTKNSTSKW